MMMSAKFTTVQCQVPKSSDTKDLIKLPCGCVVDINLLRVENSNLEMLKCPECGQIVTFYHHLKELIAARYYRVQKLSELFFTRQLKIPERKRVLLSQCQKENSSIFCSIIKTLKETRIPLSSTALSMLETKYELYRILGEYEGCDNLRNKLILNTNISCDVIQDIRKIYSTHEDLILELNSLTVYSYQEGLWQWCSVCCDVIQNNCQNCH